MPLLVILNPRFLRMKDLVLNQILPPVGRQNDIKSLSSRAKTRDLDLPLPVILNPRFLRMKDLVLNQILPPVGRQNDTKSLSSREKTRDLVLKVLRQIPHTPSAVRNDKPFPVHCLPLTHLTLLLTPLLGCCHPERSEAGRPPAGGDLV